MIAEPEVHGGIEVDEFTFLLLYTHSLWQAISQDPAVDDPDLEIAKLCFCYLNFL